jgi:anti-sigma factor RsiW
MPTSDDSRSGGFADEHERMFPQLDSFLDLDLPDREATLVAAHVAECATCMQHLVELRGVEKIYEQALSEAAPSPEYRAHPGKQLRADMGATSPSWRAKAREL